MNIGRPLALVTPTLSTVALVGTVLFAMAGGIARADDDGALCAAVQNAATSMTEVMAGKSLSVPGNTFDSFSANCAKRTMTVVMSVAVENAAEPSYVRAVQQRELDNDYCPKTAWRGFIDKGWRIETTLRYEDGAERTFTVDCSGIPEPAPSVAAAAPANIPGVVVDRSTSGGAAGHAPAVAASSPAEPGSAPGSMPTRTQHAVIDAAGNPVVLYEATGLNPDCSRTGAIIIRMVKQPAHGSVAVIQTPVFPNYPPSNVRSACNSRQVPGYRITYTGKSGYTGSDSAEFKVFWPAGAALDVTAPVQVE